WIVVHLGSRYPPSVTLGYDGNIFFFAIRRGYHTEIGNLKIALALDPRSGRGCPSYCKQCHYNVRRWGHASWGHPKAERKASASVVALLKARSCKADGYLFPASLILRKSAITISKSQMQTKLSTTLKADAIEVGHTTAVIFSSFGGIVDQSTTYP